MDIPSADLPQGLQLQRRDAMLLQHQQGDPTEREEWVEGRGGGEEMARQEEEEDERSRKRWDKV